MTDGGGLAQIENGVMLEKKIINAHKGGTFLINSGHGKLETPIRALITILDPSTRHNGQKTTSYSPPKGKHRDKKR